MRRSQHYLVIIVSACSDVVNVFQYVNIRARLYINMFIQGSNDLVVAVTLVVFQLLVGLRLSVNNDNQTCRHLTSDIPPTDKTLYS